MKESFFTKIVEYLSIEYTDTIILRNKILREPIGLVFTDDDLEEEEGSSHIACFSRQDEQIVGCCFLTPINKERIKLRQMAVDSAFQKKGIGREIMLFAEQFASQHKYSEIYLHARLEAVSFYTKLGYKKISDVFEEVGIPHVEMIKII